MSNDALVTIALNKLANVDGGTARINLPNPPPRDEPRPTPRNDRTDCGFGGPISEENMRSVLGGQTTTRTTSGQVNTRVGGGGVSQTTTTTEPNPYLRCLQTTHDQRGWFESREDETKRQEQQCGPLRGR